MKKILSLLLLTPTIANAECTPAPDCASIGYTQTSCETISLKCPFDQSKLYCFPCDSSYQYPCSEPNEYGDGESCNNKYKSCCNTNCVVGAIYYSDKTCDSCLDSSKTPIGIVVKDNELVMSRNLGGISWGESIDIASIIETEDASIAITDFNGKTNTLAIITELTSGTSSDTAAVACHKYSIEGTTASDWYLPSAGELHKYVSTNYDKINDTMTNKLSWNMNYSNSIWSSTEYINYGAWVVHFVNGNLGYGNKITQYSVTCFLPIN